MYRLVTEGNYEVTLDMMVCTESAGPCNLSVNILNQTKLPIQTCDFTNGFAAKNPSKLFSDL